MAHPDWVLKHKQKNTEIRNIKRRYYLYNITSKWDSQKKRTKKVTLGMVGVITEQDGLMPKGTIPRGRPKRKATPSQITSTAVCTKEYGASAFLSSIAKDIKDNLQALFGAGWENIFALAILRLLYQAPLKRCEFLLEESFFTETLGKISLSKDFLTGFMQNLGSKRETIVDFMKHFIKGAEHIVFDATAIVSHSSTSKLAGRGYNPEGSYDSQVNLFYMFDISKKEPNYYRLFPGNINATSALKHCLGESGVTNMVAIGDKGFCSEKNLQYLEEANLSYIMPLKRDSKYIDYERFSSSLYQEAFDGHFIYQKRPIFYTNMPNISAERGEVRRVIVFKDKSLALDEEKNYLSRISLEWEDYTMEGYQKKQLLFGAIAMISNCLELTPEEIYIAYKSRMEIETVFDAYKNLLEADRTYMRNDKSMEAWVFINHIATMLYYRTFKLLKDNDLLKQISPKDLLDRLSRVHKVKINRTWYTSEINSKTKKLIALLNIPVT
jgi:transposase